MTTTATKTAKEMEDFIIMTLDDYNYDYEDCIENPILLEKIYMLFFTKDKSKMDSKCMEPIYLLYCGFYYGEIEKNKIKSINCYKKAAKLGNITAMVNLGGYYEQVKHTEQAKIWYEKAAELGNTDAMNSLGCYYDDTENNLEQAKIWYEKAAELGNTDAMHNLGLYYEETKKDLEQAKFWYKKAYLLGDKDELKQYSILCSKNKQHNDLLETIGLETIENQFPKFKHFWNGRKKFITHDDCSICYDEKKELIPFDCLHHSYCLSCYITIDKCAYCEFPKHPNLMNDVLFS
jgi:tetratricopeptide (TPR) repeat protein